jgi:hypothetical protein
LAATYPPAARGRLEPDGGGSAADPAGCCALHDIDRLSRAHLLDDGGKPPPTDGLVKRPVGDGIGIVRAQIG